MLRNEHPSISNDIMVPDLTNQYVFFLWYCYTEGCQYELCNGDIKKDFSKKCFSKLTLKDTAKSVLLLEDKVLMSNMAWLLADSNQQSETWICWNT